VERERERKREREGEKERDNVICPAHTEQQRVFLPSVPLTTAHLTGHRRDYQLTTAEIEQRDELNMNTECIFLRLLSMQMFSNVLIYVLHNFKRQWKCLLMAECEKLRIYSLLIVWEIRFCLTRNTVVEELFIVTTELLKHGTIHTIPGNVSCHNKQEKVNKIVHSL